MNTPTNTNQPIDIAFAKRHIASELCDVVSMHRKGIVDYQTMISEIDRITDQAVKLGLCRNRWESDPAFEPRGSISHETRGRKPKPAAH